MAPNKGVSASKGAAKAVKKSKQAEKAAKKELQAIKSKGKGKLEDEEEDLEAILERYQQESRANATATVTTLDTFPPPRTGALLLPSPEPGANHLYLLFGEYFDGSRATFYDSTVRYDIGKDEWREYRSGSAPAPRSSAAGVGVPGLGDGGGILIFGGEYASPTQTTFHHYKDLWLFSVKTHTWEKIETRKGPSGRSGHRMILWRQYIILFGGFIDVGIKTNYLSDLWIFDTEEFKWKQIEHIDKDRAPGARSGFSFIPCLEGAILHGGYRKEYVKWTRPKGLPLDDTWLLRMDTDLTKLKWERRKRSIYMPSLRSGCSMTYWASKGMGVMFGGVLDEEKDEENMESVFFNDLFAYNPQGHGRWMSLNLKKRKKVGGKRRLNKVEVPHEEEGGEDGEDDGDVDMDDHEEDEAADKLREKPTPVPMTVDEPEDDADDPLKTVPLTRYNAMLAVVRNTLYIYGGIFETTSPAREYTLDDFVTLNLEKLDRFVHLRGTGLDELEWRGSDDEDGLDSGSDDEEDEGSEEEGEDGDELGELLDEGEMNEEERERRHAGLTQAEKEALRKSATRFLGIAKDTTRSEEDVLSTPLPDENLRKFYERSREFWAATAYAKSGTRGKELRREGFQLASGKYEVYKPVLEEIERIQREAEVEGDQTRRMGSGGGEGRNRR